MYVAVNNGNYYFLNVTIFVESAFILEDLF